MNYQLNCLFLHAIQKGLIVEIFRENRTIFKIEYKEPRWVCEKWLNI